MNRTEKHTAKRLLSSVLFLYTLLSPSSAEEKPFETLELILLANEAQLTIKDSSTEYEVCDVLYSHDLKTWAVVDQIKLENGTASLAWPSTPSQRGDSFFVRLSMPDTLSSILELPATPYSYANITLPAHLRDRRARNEDNTPANNPVTDQGATLGRVLFYDTKLSRNKSISCASCHIQENGFSDPLAFSIGFEGGLTGRNSMGLANAKFYERGHFFWDERADALEDQVLMPIQDDVEMGMDLPTLVTRLQNLPYYKTLFQSAYGDTTVTSEHISLALSQFVRSMLSYQSKYDAGVPTNYSNFSQLERQGLDLFNSRRAACSACHSGPNFVGTRIDNNGLEFPFIDLGVGGNTGRTQDEGKFKMSSLRNIEQSAPYMHDGRFATLEEVINHYSNGVVPNPNLGNQLGTANNRRPINFNNQEKEALLAFLKTLTDEAFLTEPKYSDPFKN